MPLHRRFAAVLFAVVAAAAAACSPVLDWREVRPEGADLVLLMPCRPSRQARSVTLAGRPVALALVACSAGGQTWGLAAGDMGDPALVGPALGELRRAAAANLGAPASAEPEAFAPRGATPNPASGRLRLAGRLPDGTEVAEQAAFFARGTWVYQATVVGATLPADAAATFFDSLRLGS